MPRQNRNTIQKQIIEQEIQNINSFFNAEELHNNVLKKEKNIGLATIYRYLKEAQNKGELFSYLCDRKKVYSKGKKSHCHFLCEKTGKIIHFEIDNIDFLKNKIPGTISSFQLEVKGTCDTCTKK